MASRRVQAATAVLVALIFSLPLAPVASGASAFSDTFDRPDSTDLGAGWLEVRGDLAISGNQLTNVPANLVHLAIVPTFSSGEQTVAASFARNSGDGVTRLGLVLRYQDVQNYYLVSRRSGGTSRVEISRVVNGIEVTLASKQVPDPATNTFFRMGGQADGARLSLTLDGVQMLSVDDTTFSTGNVGIGLGSATSPGKAHRADNFTASGSDGVPALTLTLGASPTSVLVDGSSTLSWSTTGATACAFTAGLSGERPISGTESTGPLASTTTFGMTCTGEAGSVSKSVTVTVGAPPPDATVLPTAAEVYASTAFVLPASVRSFVVLVPNESHHEELQRLISKTNGWLMPMKLTLPAGATISVVNGDNGHPHSLTIRNDTAEVFATGSLVYGALSSPVALAPSGYTLLDSTYAWIRGEITVSGAQSSGTLLVGGFFVPETKIALYRNLFPANGFRIESEYLFSGGGKKHWLVVYSTNEELAVAGPKLQNLVKANSYG